MNIAKIARIRSEIESQTYAAEHEPSALEHVAACVEEVMGGHTPLPWKRGWNRSAIHDANDLIVCDVVGEYPNIEERRDFIIRACNAHNDLVAACKKASKCLFLDARQTKKNHKRIDEACKAIASALAIAKAQPESE